LLARYDLPLARKKLSGEKFSKRESSLWRYRELLPVLQNEHIVSLGEGCTPLLTLKNLGATIGISDLRLKDESFNATGSFKARGMSVAISKARELGIKEVCAPTAGNAGGALAAYGAAAGISSRIYMPEDTPAINIYECSAYGAEVHRVRGVISDAAKVMNDQMQGKTWFDLSTLKEPYRLEGKKTLGYEVAEQYGWRLPDVIIYPTGGGTGLIGMWKAFAELGELGWIDGRRPRMVSVQSSGCAPIVKAFEAHAESSDVWDNAATIAAGLRVPKAFGDSLILEAVYNSNGCAVAVDDATIMKTIRQVAGIEGVLLCPEGAATVAALASLKASGFISPSSSILLFNTGSGLKYSEVLRTVASGSS
jgi:threonine synthase